MVLKLFFLVILLQLPGCSLVPSVLYKIDVQQGNVVTQDMLEKLKPGMTKSQVRFVLGTPLIVDAFRDNRWDYAYIRQERGELIEKKRLTIFFENERLTHFENVPLFSNNADSAESKKLSSEQISHSDDKHHN